MKRRIRYTLYMYDSMSWAIDCEDCNTKVCNFESNSLSARVIDAINEHDDKLHGRWPEERHEIAQPRWD